MFINNKVVGIIKISFISMEIYFILYININNMIWLKVDSEKGNQLCLIIT